MNTAPSPEIRALLRWPFSSTLASPFWLLLRLYLGSIWLSFGWSKVESGWLTTNAMEPLLRAIADGQMRTLVPAYRSVAELLLALNLDRALSVGIPLMELGVAIAFFGGVLLVPAAAGACLLNVNLIVSGLASWSFDGRIIAMQLLLLMGWRVAGFLGLGEGLRALGHRYAAAWRRLRSG